METKLSTVLSCLLLCWLALPWPVLAAPLRHPIHVSVTEINYNARQRSVEIAVKIFIDDLETALQKAGLGQHQLNTPKEVQASATDALMQYLARHLELRDKNRAFPLRFVGREYEGEAVWIYCEIPGIKRPENLSLRNTILLDQFEDQKNLVNIRKSSGSEEGLIFRQGESVQVIGF